MSLSRHDIVTLWSAMDQACKKIEKLIGGSLPLALGLRTLGDAIKAEDGPPSLLLRQLGQLTKHYLEELQSKTGRKDPTAIVVQYNLATSHLVSSGLDVQQSIRRARTDFVLAEQTVKRENLLSDPVEVVRQARRRKELQRLKKVSTEVSATPTVQA